MAAKPALLSLLHISDLHFGVPPAYAGGAPTHWRHLELCDGWLGHDDRALKHLADFAVDHRQAADHLLITGDSRPAVNRRSSHRQDSTSRARSSWRTARSVCATPRC
jgi:hypothetical protein